MDERDYARYKELQAKYKQINDLIPEGFFHTTRTREAATLVDAVRNLVEGHRNVCEDVLALREENERLQKYEQAIVEALQTGALRGLETPVKE